MTIKPLFDKIVVKAVEAEAKTTSGLFLPNSAQEKPQMAQVIAVGPVGVIDGKEVKMQVKVGDKISISFGNKDVSVEVLDVQETIHKEDVGNLYKYI